MTSCQKKFLFDCERLKAVKLLDPNYWLQLTEREVLCVAEKVLPAYTDDQLDKLLDEWKMYQAFAKNICLNFLMFVCSEHTY